MKDEIVKINDEDFQITIYKLNDFTKKIIELYSDKLMGVTIEQTDRTILVTSKNSHHDDKFISEEWGPDQTKEKKKIKKRPYQYWTEKEDEILKEHLSKNPDLTPTAMQVYLPGRSVSSINHHIENLKNKKKLTLESKNDTISPQVNNLTNQDLDKKKRAPNNTMLFLVWVEDKDTFTLRDFVDENPRLDNEAAFEIIDFQVKKGFLEKVSSNSYRKVIK